MGFSDGLVMLREKSLVVCFVLLSAVIGCGTTRTSNTLRTATEQLLVSDAIDRAVQLIDFTPLSGESVYFDDRHLYNAVDSGYLISSLRQHLLASGCVLKEKRDEATYVVEPRAGAVGTDNHDLLFGMPAMNVPQLALLQALPPVIPEIPIAKRRNQRGVVKIAVFAYRRETGEPAWQSGIATNESTANNIWVLGAGPFKRGTIYKGTSFAGSKLLKQPVGQEEMPKQQVVQLSQEAVFEGARSHRSDLAAPPDEEVQQVTALEPGGSQPQPSEPGQLSDETAGHEQEGAAVLAPPGPRP